VRGMARKWRYFCHQDCDRVISQEWGCQTCKWGLWRYGPSYFVQRCALSGTILGRKARKFYDLAEFGFVSNGTRTASQAFGRVSAEPQDLGRKGRVEVV